MKSLALGLAMLYFSTPVSADPCPNLSGVFGNYEELGYAVEIVQAGCTDFVMKQMIAGSDDITDLILLDGKDHILKSMPQFKTAFTYDADHLVGSSKDVKTDKLVRFFIFSLDANGGLAEQTIKLDGNGNVISSYSESLARCPDREKCIRPD